MHSFSSSVFSFCQTQNVCIQSVAEQILEVFQCLCELAFFLLLLLLFSIKVLLLYLLCFLTRSCLSLLCHYFCKFYRISIFRFYEWKKDGSKKQPYYIHFKDGRPLVFAALYDSWENSEGEALFPIHILGMCFRLLFFLL